MYGPEISDVIVDFDPETLERRPVRKSEAIALFDGNRRATKVIASIPAIDDVLDESAVDRLLIKVHCERQRLSEEFDQGQRLAQVLLPVVDAVRELGLAKEITIVDIGCANGFAVRDLAAQKTFSDDVKLVGIDFNSALVNEANILASEDGLDVEFRVANALTMEEPATIYMSTGVLHHFRDEALGEFFRKHERPETLAMVHFDLQPSLMTVFGTWLLHRARVELPLTRHDGVLSAKRAHPLQHLFTVASQSLSNFTHGIYHSSYGPFPCTLPAVFGAHPDIYELAAKQLPLRQLGSARTW